MIKRTIKINSKEIYSDTFHGHIENMMELEPKKTGESYLIEGKKFPIVQGDVVEDVLEAVN